jgi:hypothetical protein
MVIPLEQDALVFRHLGVPVGATMSQLSRPDALEQVTRPLNFVLEPKMV